MRFPTAVRLAVLAVLAYGCSVPATAQDAPRDTAGAERAYRAARKLVVEGSPEAAAALRRVVALDPSGLLADDALVEMALLHPVPRWPEQIGTLGADVAAEARSMLDRVAAMPPAADRRREAVVLRALLDLEPLSGNDAARAIRALTAVATESPGSEWGPRARHALAWIHEREGRDERSTAAYQRLVVDHGTTEAAGRAQVGLARLSIRQGRFGAAARRLQQAIDADVAPETLATNLRELAVRRLLGVSVGGEPIRLATGVRSPAGVSPTWNGGLLVGDGKLDRVTEIGPEGGVIGSWTLPELHRITVGPFGRRYAAAAESLYRLEPAGRAVLLASLGDYAPLSDLTTDGHGSFWLLDRRGKSVGRIAPGAQVPEPFWLSDGGKLGSLAWCSGELVGVEARDRSVIALGSDGTIRVLSADETARPAAVACDASGKIAILDSRTAPIRFLENGRPSNVTIDPESVGIVRPGAIALGADGALHVFDLSDGSWVRFP